MTGFHPILSLRGAKRRGPQGSAASGLRATAASGGGKGAKKLGSHLVLRKQRAAQNLSGNPEEPSDRSGWAGACVCANNVQRKCLAPTRKSVPQRCKFLGVSVKSVCAKGNGLPRQSADWLAMTVLCWTPARNKKLLILADRHKSVYRQFESLLLPGWAAKGTLFRFHTSI